MLFARCRCAGSLVWSLSKMLIQISLVSSAATAPRAAGLQQLLPSLLVGLSFATWLAAAGPRLPQQRYTTTAAL